jgi:hypothetical protein
MTTKCFKFKTLKHIEKIVGIIFNYRSLKCSAVPCEEVA